MEGDNPDYYNRLGDAYVFAENSSQALTKIAEAWRPWRGVAAHLMWAYYHAVKKRDVVPVGATKPAAKKAAAKAPKAGRSAAKRPAGKAPKAAPPAGVPSMLGGAPASSAGTDDGEE